MHRKRKIIRLKYLQQRVIDKARKFRERLQWMYGRNKMYFGGRQGASWPLLEHHALCWSIMPWGSGWYVGPTAQCWDQLVATIPKTLRTPVSNPAFNPCKKSPSLSSQKGMQLRFIQANAWKWAETNDGGRLGRTFLIVRSLASFLGPLSTELKKANEMIPPGSVLCCLGDGKDEQYENAFSTV